MERPAKERLIGAVVIVTVAWLLIPVFLDEGGGDGDAVIARELALPEADPGNGATIRRETVTLDEGQGGNAVEAVPEPAPVTALPVPETTSAPRREAPPEDNGGTASIDTSGSESGSATDGGAQAAPAEREPEPEPEPQTPAAEAEVPEPPPEPEQSTGAASDGQLWAVQLGSFSDRDNAQRLAGRLREQGYPAFLSQVTADGRTLHRVRVGPQASREAATDVAARLKQAGQPAAVVRHP